MLYKSNSIEEVKSVIEPASEKIQCIVGNNDLEIEGIISFGQAQYPGLADYADSVDTMEFLAEL